MSKLDAQRAMREAKYARLRASGPTRREAAALRETPVAPAAPAPSTEPERAAVAAPTAEAAPTAAAPLGELCGHKSMNGRVCTREAGHPQKSHRYS